MKEKEQSNLRHVIASDQRERRNRNIGEIRRLCDYDVAIAPRNDRKSGTSQSLIDVKNLFAYSLICLFAFINHFTHLTHFTHFTHFRKRSAFTLAEVLITLGVIGIVAAMTISTLVQNYQEKVTVTKVKKFYSTISQAFQLATVEYGEPSEWGIGYRSVENRDEEEATHNIGIAIRLRDIILKNVKTLKVCDNAKDQKACGIADKIYLRNGNPNVDVAGSLAQTVSASLADGGSVMFLGEYIRMRGSGLLSNTYGIIYYDVNGINPPNTYGEDFFMFYITNQNIIPTGTKNETSHPFSECNTDGGSCTAWVIENGNMDYLHCDDLSWNGKHKCSD